MKINSVAETKSFLEKNGYFTNTVVATSLFLALKMKKPFFVEGETGVGKTEIARTLSAGLKRKLIRLQCYEGLDISSAVYEWNYIAQMIEIKLRESSKNKEDIKSDVFSEKFLIKRPILESLYSSQNEPPILLIDEIDRSDPPFEAYLLEFLDEFQISIPEIGTFKTESPPIVIITSNKTRELHDAIKRRCIYQWINYPSFEEEFKIIKKKAPNLGDRLLKKIISFVQEIRKESLEKNPGIAETLDWAFALEKLVSTELKEEIVKDTLGVLIKTSNDSAVFTEKKLEKILKKINTQ